MSLYVAVAVIGQACVTIVGGGFALWKFAGSHGANQAKLDRIVHQVEPNNGASLRDDLIRLTDEFHRFTINTEQRLKLVENR